MDEGPQKRYQEAAHLLWEVSVDEVVNPLQELAGIDNLCRVSRWGRRVSRKTARILCRSFLDSTALTERVLPNGRS